MSQSGQQGVDPKGEVFKGLAALLYAAESPISGSYIDTSRMVAVYADAALGGQGLRGKAVLDVGCGFGTTTMAVARYAPRVITALDTSAAHLELMRTVLCEDTSIAPFLHSKAGAVEVLGEYFAPLLAYLKGMRTEWQQGLARHIEGLNLWERSSLDLPRANAFDVLVGNNFLHWPVNQARAAKATDPFYEAIKPLADTLASDGVAVFMEPKDFVCEDRNPVREADLEKHTMVNHPVFQRLHGLLNELLLKEFGIERKMPTTSPMFNLSQVKGTFAPHGLKLERIAHYEGVLTGDPLDAFFVRLPMVLGSIALTFEHKMELGRRVREELKRILTDEERATPIWTQNFFFILRKE